MHDVLDLKIREIYHQRFGICQLVYFASTRSWIGLNEKRETLSAPDHRGHPNMDRVNRPHYILSSQLAYLEILNPHYQPDCMVLSPNEALA